MLTITEQKAITVGQKLWNYYNNDFVTNYPRKAVMLPNGRTIENTLVYDNWISKTVNRYATSAIGKYATVEVDDAEAQELITDWHSNIDFEAKMTSIARYQGLYGYAVVKLVFKLDRDEEGGVIVAGKSAEEILAGFDIAVFGADKALARYDEYGNIDSILIAINDRMEVFFKDRVEIYQRANAGAAYKLVRTDPNPIAPYPLAFMVKNLETGMKTNSDVEGIISLQESLNDALTSLRLVNHYHGFPIYTAAGVEIEYITDEAGNQHIKPLVMGAGMTLQSASAETKFGRVEMPQITPLKESIEALTKEIAVATNSLSLLTGSIPSGQALSYMLTDFNAAVSEKQSKLKAFMHKLHKSVFKLMDYILDTKYADLDIKTFAAGHNPIAQEFNYQQAKELYALGVVSKRTLLDNSEAIENTEDELERLAEDAPVADATSPLAGLLGGS